MKAVLASLLFGLLLLPFGLARAEAPLQKGYTIEELAQAIVTLERHRLRGARQSLMKNQYVVELFEHELAEAFVADPDMSRRLLTELTEKHHALMLRVLDNVDEFARVEQDHGVMSNACNRAMLDAMGAILEFHAICQNGTAQQCASAFIRALLAYARAEEVCGAVEPY